MLGARTFHHLFRLGISLATSRQSTTVLQTRGRFRMSPYSLRNWSSSWADHVLLLLRLIIPVFPFAVLSIDHGSLEPSTLNLRIQARKTRYNTTLVGQASKSRWIRLMYFSD